MSRYGLLINYGWCSGCHSCEIACRNTKQLPIDQWGIKLAQIGPFKINEDQTEWNYIPIPTTLCDLCSARVMAGRKPACVHNCLAQCIEYGSLDKLMERMNEIGGKVNVFVP